MKTLKNIGLLILTSSLFTACIDFGPGTYHWEKRDFGSWVNPEFSLDSFESSPEFNHGQHVLSLNLERNYWENGEFTKKLLISHSRQSSSNQNINEFVLNTDFSLESLERGIYNVEKELKIPYLSDDPEELWTLKIEVQVDNFEQNLRTFETQDCPRMERYIAEIDASYKLELRSKSGKFIEQKGSMHGKDFAPVCKQDPFDPS